MPTVGVGLARTWELYGLGLFEHGRHRDGRVGVDELHDHGGDVVVAAVLVGEGHQGAARPVGVAVGAYGAENLRVGDHARQPVGAEHKHVADFERVRRQVDHHDVAHPQRAGDDVARKLHTLRRREVGHGAEVLVDEGVVLREQGDVAVAHPVAARVADVGDVRAARLGGHQHAHHGGAHAPAVGVAHALLVDGAVGHLHARDEPVFLVAEARVVVEGPGGVLPGRAVEEGPDRLRGEARRDVAGEVAPHAVGHEEEPVPLQQDEAVLVVLAVEPDICAPGGDDLQRHPYVSGAFHSRAHSVKATRAAAVDPHPRTVI